MPLILTLAQLAAGLAFLAVLGFPFVKLALPRDLGEEYGHLLVYPTGYMMLCLFAFALSGSFGVAASTATVIVSAVLAALTVILLVRGAAWRTALARARSGIVHAALLAAPMAVLMFWPLFVNGSDTYLGAVNPDYFAGLVDDWFLAHGHSIADFSKGADTFHPIDYMAGSISSSGRFACGLFAIALAELMRIEPRTALTLSIALFLLCLPLALYFFARIVFAFDVATARVAAWLIGVSAPIAMSYLYFYLGQNSGMAALVLTFAAGYALLTRPDARLLVFFTLMVNALLVVYLGMLPYAIAPLGVLGLYLLATRKLSIRALAALIGGFVAVTLVVNFGMLQSLYAMVRGWSNVIGQTLQGQYFLDFLTEGFFPLFLGVIVYPFQSSWYFEHFGPGVVIVAFVLTLAVAALILYCLARWAREVDRARAVTVIGAIAIYAVVWWIYSFQRQYGYAVFKMSSWLQYMVVPFVAYGWSLAFADPARTPRRWEKALVGGCVALYVVTNVAATLDYGYKGLGKDPAYAYIVNNFEMSGNRDYFELAPEVAKRVAPKESVGLVFVDSIQNFWVSWYLRDTRVSITAHENIPGDDENLPDIQTNRIIDYYGNVREANNVFFHGAADDYWLTWNESHINRDITIPRFATPPLWQDHTFRLFRAADNPDMVFAGRGFYRTEYSSDTKPYWWPDVTRWTAEGGEIYFLRPSKPGGSYRLAFDGIVGYELPNDERTVELWLDKVKFDEVKLVSSARYVSKPFTAAPDVNKLVIKVRERVKPGKRPLPLWNKQIPYDYRQLNLLVANVRVLHDGEEPAVLARNCAGAFRGNDIIGCALGYNGIQIDRWIGRSATLRLPAGSKAQTVRLTGSVPDSLGFKFPFALRVRIDGAEHEASIAAPGAFTLEFPRAAAADVVAIEIVPAQAAELERELRIRHKLVTQALRLDAVELR